MNTLQLKKSNFIKFNVSPQFKALAEKKAEENGMTVSELGRMLFGAFVTGMAKPTFDISPEFTQLADRARQDFEAGKTVSISTPDELKKFLASTR